MKLSVKLVLFFFLFALIVSGGVLYYVYQRGSAVPIQQEEPDTSSSAAPNGIQLIKETFQDEPGFVFYSARGVFTEVLSNQEDSNITGNFQIQGDTSSTVHMVLFPPSGGKIPMGIKDAESGDINYSIAEVDILLETIKPNQNIELQFSVKTGSTVEIEDLEAILQTGVVSQKLLLVPNRITIL